MKVSFLITYYNQQKYVRQSLESILSISKKCDWEILIGDDGSSDQTIHIVKEYVLKYPNHIFLFIMPRNLNGIYDSVKRASANRLNLLEHATGDLFCVLDGDDYYCDIEFVNESVKICESNINVSVVAFGFKYVFSESEGQRYVLPVDGEIFDKERYLTAFYIPAGACVFRRNTEYNRISFLKSVGYFDDNDILINNLNFGELYSVNRVIYAYRQSEDSIYNSMNRVEQAVLNVQGFDIDVQYIGGFYKNILQLRNASSILTMYVWKTKLEETLGSEKYYKYLNTCKELEDSLTYKIFAYNQLGKKERHIINKLILKLVIKKPKETAKIIISRFV